MATRDQEFDVNRVRSENKRLQRAVEELSILNKIAVTIISQCTRHLKVEQAAIILVDERS